MLTAILIDEAHRLNAAVGEFGDLAIILIGFFRHGERDKWASFVESIGLGRLVDDPVYAAYAGSLYGIPVPRGVVI